VKNIKHLEIDSSYGLSHFDLNEFLYKGSIESLGNHTKIYNA